MCSIDFEPDGPSGAIPLLPEGPEHLSPHPTMVTDRSELDPGRRALRDHLLQYSVRTGDFVLKSGKSSTWFIDAKQTTCRPQAMLLIAELLLEVVPEDVTAIGGLTMGADAVAFGVAAIAATKGRMLTAFSVRKEVKDHGGGGRIAGVLEPGARVVVTEDCVTRGISPMEAVKIVREAGAVPVMIASVVDRGGTCAKLAADEGIAFVALLTAPDLGLPYEGGLD